MYCDPGHAGPRRRRGFTLGETLLLVLLMAVMVGIVIADFTQAATDPRLCRLAGDVQMMREKIQRYRRQHADRLPALEKFEAQMVGTTGLDGAIEGEDFGPYLLRIPPNPFTGRNRVGAGPYGSSDWYYNETTGEFRANDIAAHGAY